MDKLKNALYKAVKQSDPIGLSYTNQEVEEIKKEKYVIKTNKGYIKGDMHKGVEFVSKEEARLFNVFGLHAYWDSICSDMFQFFNVIELEVENIE